MDISVNQSYQLYVVDVVWYIVVAVVWRELGIWYVIFLSIDLWSRAIDICLYAAYVYYMCCMHAAAEGKKEKRVPIPTGACVRKRDGKDDEMVSRDGKVDVMTYKRKRIDSAIWDVCDLLRLNL